MPVYVLAQLKINDRDRYNRYAARFFESMAGYDGRLLAADEAVDVAEGDWDRDKAVLIEFADRAEYERWATSDLYQEISKDRTAATDGTVLVINGFGAPPNA